MAAGLRYADRARPNGFCPFCQLTEVKARSAAGPHRVPELCRGVLHGPGEGGRRLLLELNRVRMQSLF